MKRTDLLTFSGITQPVTEWALDYGIPARTIMLRISGGMPVARAITKPIPAKPGDRLPEEDIDDRSDVKLTYDGRTLTLSQWALVTGISVNIIHSRIFTRKWTTERALTRTTGNRGVVFDFAALEGTGAQSTTQETSNLTFSKDAAE